MDSGRCVQEDPEGEGVAADGPGVGDRSAAARFGNARQQAEDGDSGEGRHHLGLRRGRRERRVARPQQRHLSDRQVRAPTHAEGLADNEVLRLRGPPQAREAGHPEHRAGSALGGRRARAAAAAARRQEDEEPIEQTEAQADRGPKRGAAAARSRAALRTRDRVPETQNFRQQRPGHSRFYSLAASRLFISIGTGREPLYALRACRRAADGAGHHSETQGADNAI